MIPVNQTIVDSINGNCMQAVIASLFDLEIDQVPNFIKYNHNWFPIYRGFINLLGYEYVGDGYVHSDKLDEMYSVNGYFDASVKSRTFQGGSHAVIIDVNGFVIHDPNKSFQDVNVLESGELTHWFKFEKLI